jgi:hypothetical protein
MVIIGISVDYEQGVNAETGRSRLRQNDKTRLGVLRVREIAYQKIVSTDNTYIYINDTR